MKSRIFTGRPPTDDKIWVGINNLHAHSSDISFQNTQENKFRNLTERNDQLVRRLLSNDVTEEVKQLDETIQNLYSKLEMYENGHV